MSVYFRLQLLPLLETTDQLLVVVYYKSRCNTYFNTINFVFIKKKKKHWICVREQTQNKPKLEAQFLYCTKIINV